MLTYTWEWNQKFSCWSLENVIYCKKPSAAELQCMNIYVPKEYIEKGEVSLYGQCGKYSASSAPIILENSVGGYMQARPEPLEIKKVGQMLLSHGIVYITCGARGRGTRTEDGQYGGKAPAAIVDIKAAIRMIRELGSRIPGDKEKIISFGGSAGGALSALSGVTGNSPEYHAWLEEIGAYEQRDDVFAVQSYCPITDLENADAAYEWMYRKDRVRHDPFMGDQDLTAFQNALSDQLYELYIQQFNRMKLIHPEEKTTLVLGPDGRSGNAYEYLMNLLEKSLTEKLREIESGESSLTCTVEEYLSGKYTREIQLPDGIKVEQGEDISSCVSWAEGTATIAGLDEFLLCGCPRMKFCQAFDGLDLDVPENEVFGASDQAAVHFDPTTYAALQNLKFDFPEETARLSDSFRACLDNPTISEQRKLFNPMSFLTEKNTGNLSPYFRIRLGSRDGHTSYTVSMALACRLAEAGAEVEYSFLWGEGHGQPDRPEDLIAWVDRICEQ